MPSPKQPKKPKATFNNRQLTQLLRETAAEIHDFDQEHGALSRGEALVRLLWKKALGWTEIKIDDDGNEKKIVHQPESWALQVIYDRMEGKTPQALIEDTGHIKAKDKVSELTKNRLNDLTATVGKGPGGPPKIKKKSD